MSFLLNPVTVVFLLRENLQLLGKKEAARNSTVVAVVFLIIEVLIPVPHGGLAFSSTFLLIFIIYIRSNLFTKEE